jgi:hypothetical protein
MPIADKSTLDRLVLVKQLYQQGLVQSNSRHNLASRIMSVISFDLAVETMLRLIIHVLDPKSTPNVKNERNFPQYRDYADKLMIADNLGPLPDKRRISDVHDIRNGAQHNAQYPDITQVSDCRTYIRDFLHQVTIQIWKLPFDKISLTNLVQHNQAKKFLVAAEESLANKDYNEASKQAVAAIEWTLNQAAQDMVGQGESNKVQGEIVVNEHGRQNERLGRKMYENFWKMQDTLRIISLGLNYTDYIYYGETKWDLGLVAIFPRGSDEPDVSHLPGMCILPSTAEYLVSYAMDTILQVETMVGDLNRPFGIKIRFLCGRSMPRPTE